MHAGCACDHTRYKDVGALIDYCCTSRGASCDDAGVYACMCPPSEPQRPAWAKSANFDSSRESIISNASTVQECSALVNAKYELIEVHAVKRTAPRGPDVASAPYDDIEYDDAYACSAQDLAAARRIWSRPPRLDNLKCEVHVWNLP